ncbi:hypothetical protein E1212_27340 [Jiangella ureilytica]|uniref:Uncharacterized protein n=1 Tax=Jiangella ureilytica TaxID=2530374 RepID=A0A4R4RAY1_9ACTN|nr:hypothetical protein [Jiangella ureilytica]TDC46236.1 hypothetical protein E1212_27340 [Jiangella ureilytica]
MNEILAELRQVFDGAVKDPDGYRIVHGYDSVEKNYLVAKRTIIHSFVVGYVPGAKELAILPVDGDDGALTAGEPLYVTPSTLRSAKKDLQRRYVIRTTDGATVRFTVLPKVPRLLQAAYVLGVEQRDEAAAFAEYFDTLR